MNVPSLSACAAQAPSASAKRESTALQAMHLLAMAQMLSASHGTGTELSPVMKRTLHQNAVNLAEEAIAAYQAIDPDLGARLRVNAVTSDPVVHIDAGRYLDLADADQRPFEACVRIAPTMNPGLPASSHLDISILIPQARDLAALKSFIKLGRYRFDQFCIDNRLSIEATAMPLHSQGMRPAAFFEHFHDTIVMPSLMRAADPDVGALRLYRKATDASEVMPALLAMIRALAFVSRALDQDPIAIMHLT
ncbi:MAG TPA: hypothetical protein VHE37_15400, partial [Nevskiaceae bacterium]|nr:hypothetical protein [Nevskiaceae bacterium]